MSDTTRFQTWSVQAKCPACLFPMHYSNDMQSVHCKNNRCKQVDIEYEAPFVELKRVSPA